MTLSGRYRRSSLGFLQTLILIGLVFSLPPAGAQSSALTGEVTWVYDGDTLELAGIGKVRLIGIDVPERKPSVRDRFLVDQGIEPARLREIHAQAIAFVIKTAKGKMVDLSLDRDTRDRHGRFLAYVVLPDGRNLNRLLLEKGLAVVYRRFDFDLKDDFLSAEAEARRRGHGLWAKSKGPS